MFGKVSPFHSECSSLLVLDFSFSKPTLVTVHIKLKLESQHLLKNSEFVTKNDEGRDARQ